MYRGQRKGPPYSWRLSHLLSYLLLRHEQGEVHTGWGIDGDILSESDLGSKFAASFRHGVLPPFLLLVIISIAVVTSRACCHLSRPEVSPSRKINCPDSSTRPLRIQQQRIAPKVLQMSVMLLCMYVSLHTCTSLLWAGERLYK